MKNFNDNKDPNKKNMMGCGCGSSSHKPMNDSNKKVEKDTKRKPTSDKSSGIVKKDNNKNQGKDSSKNHNKNNNTCR